MAGIYHTNMHQLYQAQLIDHLNKHHAQMAMNQQAMNLQNAANQTATAAAMQQQQLQNAYSQMHRIETYDSPDRLAKILSITTRSGKKISMAVSATELAMVSDPQRILMEAYQKLHAKAMQEEMRWMSAAAFPAHIIEEVEEEVEKVEKKVIHSINFKWHKFRWGIERMLHLPISLIDWSVGLM